VCGPIQEVYVKGEERGDQRHIEVTGVDFYNSIEQLPGLQRFYALTRQQVFDIYEFLRRGSKYVIHVLSSLHTGILPAYLRWFVAGLLLVVWVVTETGS